MVLELGIGLLKRHNSHQSKDVSACEWPECGNDGVHRAPKSRNELSSFRWFCIIHARKYNRSWNYYDGMSDDEVEADVRRDTVWQRPSWRLGANETANLESAINLNSIHDPFDILHKARSTGDNSSSSDIKYSSDQTRALAIFGLDRPGDAVSIKQRYKELVKRYHPDAKGADASSDEKIKDVNQAYKILMDFIGS